MPTPKPHPKSAHHLAGRTGPNANATKPAKQKHDIRQVFVATAAESAAYTKAAKRAGASRSAWMRETLNTAAKP